MGGADNLMLWLKLYSNTAYSQLWFMMYFLTMLKGIVQTDPYKPASITEFSMLIEIIIPKGVL